MMTEESTNTLSVDDFKRAIIALEKLDKDEEERNRMFWYKGKMWKHDGKGNIEEFEQMKLSDL